MKMEIILIRHGETTWNAKGKLQGQADPVLTEEGLNQANILAQQLASEKTLYSQIISSERTRAKQVAKILSYTLSIPVKFDSNLNSRNLGDFSGKTLEELERTVPILFKSYISGEVDFAPPNGETTRAVLSRSSDFLANLRNNYSNNERIIIVTHRGNIGALHFLITGEKMEDPIRKVRNCVPYKYQLTETKSNFL